MVHSDACSCKDHTCRAYSLGTTGYNHHVNELWERAYLVRCRYELFMDDLPVWGFVGPPPEETKDEEHIYIYTHKSFDINYNDNRVRAPTAAGLPHSLVICMFADYESEGTSWCCRAKMMGHKVYIASKHQP